MLVVVVVGTRTLSPRPRALEEADRVRLVQDRRRGSPVVFGEVGDVAHRRVLPAGDRGVEPRRLPPRRRREVGQRAAAEALTCVCFFVTFRTSILGLNCPEIFRRRVYSARGELSRQGRE